MRKIFILMLVIFLAGCVNNEDAVISPAADPDELSYAFGVSVGTSLQGLDLEVDLPSFMAGLKDVLVDGDATMNTQEANDTINGKIQEMRTAQAEKSLTEGNEFLEKNGKRSEVSTTESGLQYEVLLEGNGPKPGPESRVTVHYTGTLLNGEVFDSSVERGSKATFGLNQVIPGWTEGIQLMNVGSKYKFYIPSQLAYGPGGAGGAIGPNETLIFEVELFEINDDASQQ